MISKRIWIGCVGLLFCTTALADQLILINGDRITGTISRVWDAEITIEPDYADEFKVEISAVKSIIAERDFEIELADGRSVVAQFTGGDEDGNQLLTIGGDTIAIPLEKLLELEEPQEPFEWESNVVLSASINKGNTDSETGQLRADTAIRFGDHRHFADVTFNREEQDGETTREQELFRYNYNWLFRDPWFIGFSGSYERDPVRELDYRYILAATLGRDIWNRPRRSLNVQAGLGYSTEDIGNESEEHAVATWQLRFRQDFLGDDIETFHNHTVTTNLTGRANTIVNTSTGFSYDITDVFYATLSVDFDYETEPADDAENEDLALLIGLGAEF